MRISKRVYLVASGRLGCSMTHMNDCNVYAVDCGSKYLLVDAGVGVDSEQILQNLQDDGISAGQIDLLLLTHGHLDHSGGAAFLRRNLDITVAASTQTSAALEAADEMAISLQPAKRAGIYSLDFRLEPCLVSKKLDGGETWEVGECNVTAVRTPGHSADMLSYLIRTPDELLCFCGDTVFHGGKILISDVWDCSPAAYSKALCELSTYPVDGLYPGHGIWSVREGALQIRSSLPYVDRLLLPPNLL